MDYYTADLHIGHANIIQHTNRPFENVHQQTRVLRDNWNAVVQEDDTVYILGDFIWKMGRQECLNYLDSLNGQKVLIEGNHDKAMIKRGWYREAFDNVHTLKVKKYEDERARYHTRHVTLCHYPMRQWYISHRGGFHLHGHSHTNTFHPAWEMAMDVGVDCNSIIVEHAAYTPFSWDECREYLVRKQDAHFAKMKKWWYRQYHYLMVGGYKWWAQENWVYDGSIK